MSDCFAHGLDAFEQYAEGYSYTGGHNRSSFNYDPYYYYTCHQISKVFETEKAYLFKHPITHLVAWCAKRLCSQGSGGYKDLDSCKEYWLVHDCAHLKWVPQEKSQNNP